MSTSPPHSTVESSSPKNFIRRVVIGSLLLVAVIVVVVSSRSGSSVERLIQEGAAALDRQDFPLAIKRGEQAVKLAPELPAGWKLLAEAKYGQGDLEQSLSALKHWSREPSSEAADLGVRLGSQFMQENRIQLARIALHCAAEADPQAFEPHRLLAQIAGVTGRSSEVQACLIELIRRKAFTRDDLLMLGSASPIISDPKRVAEIIRTNPDDPSPLLANALDALSTNRVDECISLLLQVVRTHPEDLDVQGILGEVYADFYPDRFAEWHTRLPVSAETESKIWLARGKWLNKRGATTAAIRCLHESLQLEPENLSATTLLAQLLVAVGQKEMGNTWTERARLLQRIVDLNSRMKEPHAATWIGPMIQDLETAGQLWEAWAWSTIESESKPADPAVFANRDRLATLLPWELPRTKAEAIPGRDFDWGQFPRPASDLYRSTPVLPGSDLANQKKTAFYFEDQAGISGLDFRYVNSYKPERVRRIFEAMGAGVGVLDFDRDGWPDLYFPQGNTSSGESLPGPSDELYRNVSGQRFRKVTDSSGIHETSYSHGVSTGDFDNDGFPDVYVSNIGRNRLFHNQGDGTFEDVTEEAGLQQNHWTVSCAIADLNGDGSPELFDVNYLEGEDFRTRTCSDERQRRIVCRPTVFPPALDTVSLSGGDGSFRELQTEAGLDLPQGMGLGLIVADFNQDQRLDVFVANDQTANYLLINETDAETRTLRFRDEAHLRGVAFDANGVAQACMGIASADINRDGLPDLYVTNFAQESNTLYVSHPGGFYQDETQPAGLRTPSFEPLGFGTQFFDADNDGLQDLIVMNGHIDELFQSTFRMKPQMFRGLPGTKYEEIFASEVGEFLDQPRLGRGLATLDWNRDRRTDFVATDLEGPVLLSSNRTQSGQHVLRLHLVGTISSRDAVGATVIAKTLSNDSQTVQLTAGDGYESKSEMIIHIGTGLANHVQELEIVWPSGRRSRFEAISCDREWIAVESSNQLFSISAE